jgi:hypothetical protein
LCFTLIILCGYVAGGAAKLVPAGRGEALAPTFWLYGVNGSMVAANLALQWYYGALATEKARLRAAHAALPGRGAA